MGIPIVGLKIHVDVDVDKAFHRLRFVTHYNKVHFSIRGSEPPNLLQLTAKMCQSQRVSGMNTLLLRQ